MSLNRALLVAVIILTPFVTLTQPLTAHAQVILTEKLRSLDNDGNDFFGSSIAVNGNTALIGAERVSQRGAGLAGAAYLFDVATGQQRRKLTASDPTEFARFGRSVALSGDRALIGASGAYNGRITSGAAYLFDANTGVQISRLHGSDSQVNDFFGHSVALSGNTALVGAISNAEKGPESGAAYLFNAATGQQRLKLTANDETARDYFGAAVALSGGIALVGAPGESGGGAAYVFDTATGNQLLKIQSGDGAGSGPFSDDFGRAVVLSGNLALIGAPGDNIIIDGVNRVNVGSAYLFDITTGRQLFKFIASDAGDDAYFGFSVSLSGNFALIGAPLDEANGPDSGSAYKFDITTGLQVDKIVAGDGRVNDNFGDTVALSGNNLFVGSQLRDGGSVYVLRGSAAPEPGTVALVAFALPIGIGILRRRSG